MSLRMSNTFQTQIASIMEVMATAVLTEISKVVDRSATLCFEMSHSCDNKASKVKFPAVGSETMMTQLASVIEILAQEAVNKICKLAIEELAVLRLEVSRSRNEIGTLKRKLELMEKELRTVVGGAAGERPLKTHSVGVQGACELRATETEEPDSAVISVWGDAVPAVVEEEVAPLQCVGVIAEPSNIDDRIESIIIKEEGPEEDLQSSPLEEKLDTSKDGPTVVTSVAAGTPAVAHQNCVEEVSLPTEGEKPYGCAECGASFPQKCLLKKHKLVHTGEKPFCCDVCGKTFNRAYGLKMHQIVHTGEKAFSCEVCGKSFTIASNLHRHQRIHTGEKPFCCTVCGKSFNQANTLKAHKLIHTGEKPYVCATCGKSFNQKSRVIKHQQVHAGVKAHVCVVCGKGFSAAVSLASHQLSHAGESPCRCVVCGEAMTSLKNHQQCLAALNAFVCVICGKSFSASGSLKVHEKTHSGEKRFSCPSCGKTFTQQSSLKTHQNIHSGEKPFCCGTCGKSFRILGNLHRHQRIHTGEKPYRCFLCGKSFNPREQP
ncbi:hypothetical protein ANANG_G00237960 [Anguilla anguilla]|uniref:C2H2-type domain-containing protein n=1 Tax=Anguilla anguilla TaxID=7936 RepID=A0A9D3RRS6_ANGAN|nr:hypothetical protein ANANG_G00237960 [Anguilla anguilla]